MKYSTVDWSRWDDRPEEEVYTAWLAVRKMKKSATTQYALNLAAKHINALYQRNYSANEVLDIAIENSWAGLKWVYKQEAKNGFKVVPIVGENVVRIDRSTRDISLEEELNDRSWAN